MKSSSAPAPARLKYAHLPAEERTDWILFKHHGSRTARQRLVTLYAAKHDELACWVYRKVQPFLPPHEVEDGISAAKLYLIDAVDKYNIDHPKQPQFSTFATHHISGKLRNYANRVLRKNPLETNAIPYEDLCAGDGRDEPAAERMEGPILAGIAMADLVGRARRAFSAVEFHCFEARFLRHRSVRAVEEELAISSTEARSTIRRVQKKLKPLMRDAGLID